MTAAVTPKGERRRYALVRAAAELLCEGGFEAVGHRAVAQRAGLPLASTTYYFSSLEDLVVSAVDECGMLEIARLRARVAALPRRRRGSHAIADILVDLLVGADGDPQRTEMLIARYERFVASARQPRLRAVQQRVLRQRAEAAVDVVDRSGRSVRSEQLAAMVCAIDGAVLAGLVDDRADPRQRARDAVLGVIDTVAPYQQHAAGF